MAFSSGTAALSACLLHRGPQTLPVRVRAQQEAAGKLAARLEQHPAVAHVAYPALVGNASERIVGHQMPGPGSVLSFEVRGGQEAAEVAERCALIQHPASLTHRPVTGGARPDAGLLRLSVGPEAADDLLADLYRALGG